MKLAPVSRGADTSKMQRTLVPTFTVLACVIATTGAADAGTQALEQVIVTATRQPEPLRRLPFSISLLGADEVALVGSTHHAEIMNRAAGTMIQRGSGQESLTAIRSPVLTGAGSCGAFLFMENGVPIRPVGFCNVNELFEVNTEQAHSIEVLRGPGTALYGSNAVHGAVNVLPGTPADRPRFGISVEGGPDEYGRVKLAGRQDLESFDVAAAGLYTHDDGWRDDSGYDEGKLNLTAMGREEQAPWRVDLAATVLNQETAGFIEGKDAYKDDALRTSNPNPEAFRDASAVRLTGYLAPAVDWPARLELRPYLRASRMEFLQHFLIGKPLERNGQQSAGLMSALVWDESENWSATAGVDLEFANSYLLERQDQPATEGSPAANASRPVGKHYDYDVDSWVVAAYAQVERRFAERWSVRAGLRAEYVEYDYDNRMLAGNTDENGTPCPSGCLYNRPDDRSDSFTNLAPKLSLSFAVTPDVSTYVSLAKGFRPPEITELYRLQRLQTVADLDSEQIDSLELGVKGYWSSFGFTLAAFDMDKSEVILRDANGFNVSDGRTSHRGIEYEASWRPIDSVLIRGAGTYARHRYEFSRLVEGGERIEDGNDVDTAPRQIHVITVGWSPTTGIAAEAEWMVAGDYWLDASNAHRYAGHELLNLRASFSLPGEWQLAARLTNALDRDYADRADFAFGEYRYFPGRDRTAFLELSWQTQ
jgi:outer membrane receptor protein involved in Fe transport